MPQFQVQGYDRKSGERVTLIVEADSEDAAVQSCGLVVEKIRLLRVPGDVRNRLLIVFSAVLICAIALSLWPFDEDSMGLLTSDHDSGAVPGTITGRVSEPVGNRVTTHNSASKVWIGSGDAASVIGSVRWESASEKMLQGVGAGDGLDVSVRDAGSGWWYGTILTQSDDGFWSGMQHTGSLDSDRKPHGLWWSLALVPPVSYHSWWWHGERVTNVRWHRLNGDAALLRLDTSAPLIKETWLENQN